MTPNIMKADKKATGLPNDRYDDPNHPRNRTGQSDAANNSTSASTSPSTATEANAVGNTGGLDGDHTAKAFDAGAKSATNVTDLTDGIHEAAHQSTAAGDKTTGQGTSIFNKDGLVGGAFKGDGVLGSLGNKIGGPFSSQGTIGKEFEAHGKIGGTFQEQAKKNEEH